MIRRCTGCYRDDERGLFVPCGACERRYHAAMARLVESRGRIDLAAHHRALAKESAEDDKAPRRVLGAYGLGAARRNGTGTPLSRPAHRRAAPGSSR